MSSRETAQPSSPWATSACGAAASFGVFGFPRFRHPHHHITGADIVHIPRWSPWGWGIIRLPRRGWILTTRTGPAIRLHLTDNATVTLTVADPAQAIAALNLPTGHALPSDSTS